MKFSMGLSDIPASLRERLFNDDGRDSIAVAYGDNANSFVSLHPQTNYTTATVTVVFGTSTKSLMGFGLQMGGYATGRRGDYAVDTFAMVLSSVLSDYYKDFIVDQADLIAPKARVSISSGERPATVVPAINPATRQKISSDGDTDFIVIAEFMFRSTETDIPTESVTDEDRGGRALRYSYADIGVTMGSSVISDYRSIRRRMRSRMKGHFHTTNYPALEAQIKEFSVLLYDGAEKGDDTPEIVRTKYPNLDDLIATGETFDIEAVLSELIQAGDASQSESRREFLNQSVREITKVVEERNRLLWYVGKDS